MGITQVSERQDSGDGLIVDNVIGRKRFQEVQNLLTRLENAAGIDIADPPYAWRLNRRHA